MAIKYPNLVYNHFFPFYTQNIVGEKKYYYKTDTVIHVSKNMGILISLAYKQKKICLLHIERITKETTLSDYRITGNYISYIDFAKEVFMFYKQLSNAIEYLSSEPAYYRKLIFSDIFKYNRFLELTLEYRKIRVDYSDFDYKIENGKKIRPVKSRNISNSEEDKIMDRLNAAVSVIDNQTTFREFDNKQFDECMNRTWEYFIEYFSPPKFIRKSEYVPK